MQRKVREHPQLAEALRSHQRAFPGLPTARVFRQAVTNRTRVLDFLRAGIARRVDVLDAQGNRIPIGKRTKNQKYKSRIDCTDAEGRIADLHCLRTTLGTNLARAGVTPQVAQKIMRHSDYRTTLKSYTVLSLHDSAGAMNKIPTINAPKPEEAKATGTDGLAEEVPLHPEAHPIRLDSDQTSTTRCNEANRGRKGEPRSLAHDSGRNRDVSGGKERLERRRLELPTPSLQS